MAKAKASSKPVKRVFNARPDTVDFRDRMYVPTLIEVPEEIKLADYRSWRVPVLDQGPDGACTGFALATVAHYLLRTREVYEDKIQVSPWMFYEIAKRYDEWPGTRYEGSSARGAMKGWHKHGVCKKSLWDDDDTDRRLTAGRAEDAGQRPLGAYFRVNHKDIVAMHSAISEVGVLYASATVHAGWNDVGRNGYIPRRTRILGGHAFVIVAYDEVGFWIQNSWGRSWGRSGCARISYDDWLENGHDVWVARLAAPIKLEIEKTAGAAKKLAVGQRAGYGYSDLRPHVVCLENDGELQKGGTYGATEEELETILTEDFEQITADWRTKRILLYAHGGLVGKRSAIDRVAEYREALLNAEVYPLAFIWKSDYWTTLKNMLEDVVRRRRTEGILDSTKDFMLDRLDDTLEPIARVATGKAQWDEMKENALMASTSKHGGARFVAGLVGKLVAKFPKMEIHVAGHSAGSILQAPVVQLLGTKGAIDGGPMMGSEGLNCEIKTCTLWAPACTVDLFEESYRPLIEKGRIGHFSLFTLTDKAERDDHCANIYHKSLLYLVSNAFEDRFRIPLLRNDGEPILGMEKFVNKEIKRDRGFKRMMNKRSVEWVLSPNQRPEGSVDASTSRHHGDFDDDIPTVKALLARITGRSAGKAAVAFQRSKESRRDRRRGLG